MLFAVPEPTGTEEDVVSETYETVKKFAQLLVHLGTGQILQIWGTNGTTKEAPAGLDGFVEVMYNMTQHPSPVVAGMMLPVWLAFYRHEFGRNHPALNQARVPLLEKLLLLTIRPGNADQGFREGLSCEQQRLGARSERRRQPGTSPT